MLYSQLMKLQRLCKYSSYVACHSCIYSSFLVLTFHTALPCPPNSHYSDCTPPCPPTCADLFPIFCPLPPNSCVEGCQCDAGFVLSDGMCVQLSNCGCVDNKGEYHDVSCNSTWIHIKVRIVLTWALILVQCCLKGVFTCHLCKVIFRLHWEALNFCNTHSVLYLWYRVNHHGQSSCCVLQVGDSWVTEHCDQKCTCSLGGVLSCKAFQCSSRSVCALNSDGERYCKPEGES